MRSLGILHRDSLYRLKYTNSDSSRGATDTTLTRRTSFFNALVTIKNTLLMRRGEPTADNATLKWSASGYNCSIGVRVSDNFYTKNHDEQCTELQNTPTIQDMLKDGILGVACYTLNKMQSQHG